MQANPGTNGVQHASPQVELIQWVQDNLINPLLEYLDDNHTGAEFAELVKAWWPKRLYALQHMQHPQIQGQEGAPVIIELFKHSDVWAAELAPREQQFRQFVTEFCQWSPTGEPPPVAQHATAAAGTAPASSNVGPGTTSWDEDEPEAANRKEERP